MRFLRYKRRLLGVVCAVLVPCVVDSKITLHGSDSKLSLASGVQFYIDSQITDFNGTLNDDGATISGDGIIFSEGFLQRDGGEFLIDGEWATSGVVTLAGDKRLVIDREAEMPGPYVSSAGNFVVGVPNFSSDVTLQDVSTTLTVELSGSMNRNIVLNNGLLYVGSDLVFDDGFLLTGSGICDLGGRGVSFGSKPLEFTHTISWQNAGRVVLNSDVMLSGTWVFNDITVLSGGGRSVELSGDGSLIVDHRAMLLLDNVRVRGLVENSGSAGTFNVRCLDAASSVTFRHSDLIMDGDYSFTTGCMAFEGKNEIHGGYTFDWRSPNDCTINADSRLTVGRGSTFRYDSSSGENTHLVLADATSELYLDACTLHGTTVGLRLTTGELFVNDFVVLSSDATVQGEAVELNTSTLEVNVLSGATLDIQGIVVND